MIPITRPLVCSSVQAGNGFEKPACDYNGGDAPVILRHGIHGAFMVHAKSGKWASAGCREATRFWLAVITLIIAYTFDRERHGWITPMTFCKVIVSSDCRRGKILVIS